MGEFIDISGLEDLEARFAALGKYRFADALQEAVNELADIAIGDLAGRFDRNIEGGPAAFTKIKPGKGSSSVIAKKRSGAKRGVAEASIVVRPKQSAYLKYMLGEDDRREPGDVGIATRHNYIPIETNLADLGIKLTKQGGLPRNALAKLLAMSKEGKVGPAVRRRGDKGRFLATGDGDQTLGAPFFGRPRKKDGSLGTLGWWLRGTHRGDKTLPLALAIPVSDYSRKDYLVPSWNRSVDLASSKLNDRLRSILEEVLADMIAGRKLKRRRQLDAAKVARDVARAKREAEIVAGIRVRRKKGRPKGSKNKVKAL